jgi:predicted Zn finger-like uncharacterized protein
MDVTCNRCGIVYEFEESLISTTGMTVKCTQCGHLFKVHRPAPRTPLPPPELAIEPSRWRVRRIDGSTHTLESLAELTNLIGAGQFSGEDEISRTGQVWKKLGEVAELASLFERPQRVRRLSEPPPERKAAIENAKRTTLSEWPTGVREARKRALTDPRFQVMGGDIALDPPEARRPQLSDNGVHADALVTGPHAAFTALASSGGVVETPAVAPAPPVPPLAAAPSRPSPRDAVLDAADADDRLPRRNRRRNRNLIGALLVGAMLIVAGVSAGLFWRAHGVSEPVVDPAQALVMRGDEALAAHRLERFEQAIALYTQALPYHPDDPHILSSLSRTYAVWSSWLGWHLHELHTTAAATASEVSGLEAEVKRLTEQAKRHGERAAQRNPGNEEASVALSDALRLSGNLVGARSELDRARATEGVSSAETLRVAAMLAIDEADGNVRAGRRFAEQAVAQDPTLIRARFLLARCLLSDDDLEGAELQLAAVRKIDPNHPLLGELAGKIERARTHGPREAGRTAEAGTAAKQADVKTRAEAPAAAGASRSTPAPGSDDTTTDPLELVRRGEAALERGAVPIAQHAFERALELDPYLARAKTGLGYVALEHNQANLAVSYFRPAARRDNPDALIGLGDAYRKLGRARDALEAYQEYLHRYPKGDRRSIAQHQSELLSEQLDSAP